MRASVVGVWQGAWAAQWLVAAAERPRYSRINLRLSSVPWRQNVRLSWVIAGKGWAMLPGNFRQWAATTGARRQSGDSNDSGRM